MAIRSPLLAMDLLPFVSEAVERLGYFRPSITEWMVAKLLAAEARGSDLERVLDDGWQEHLTATGLADPIHAVSVTYRRARAAARDSAYRARTMPLLTREPPIFPGVIFTAALQSPCAAAVALDRSTHRLPQALPLPDCDREVCGCFWRTLSKQEMGE